MWSRRSYGRPEVSCGYSVDEYDVATSYVMDMMKVKTRKKRKRGVVVLIRIFLTVGGATMTFSITMLATGFVQANSSSRRVISISLLIDRDPENNAKKKINRLALKSNPGERERCDHIGIKRFQDYVSWPRVLGCRSVG